MKPSVASLRLQDLVEMAHVRRRHGSYLLAAATFMAAAPLAGLVGYYDYETLLLRRAWECVNAYEAQR